MPEYGGEMRSPRNGMHRRRLTCKDVPMPDTRATNDELRRWRRRSVFAGLVASAALVLASPLAGIGGVAFGVPAASAHQPEVNAGSPDPDAPYRVPFPNVSRAIRGVVPAGGVDWYALELDRPTALTLWLLTPMVDACDGFAPTMRITDGAHYVADVGSWNGRRWFEATSIVTRLDGSVRIDAFPWGRFQHGGERSRSGPYARPVLGPGTTLIAIEAPADRGGAYTFAPGDLEIPGGGVDPRVAAWWRTCPASWEG